jgi:hypothetical protein
MQLQIHQIQLPDPASATLLFIVPNLPVMHICGDVAQHGAGVYRLTQLLPNILTNGLIYRKRDRGHPPAQQGAWCIFQCCIRIRIHGPMPLTNAS